MTNTTPRPTRPEITTQTQTELLTWAIHFVATGDFTRAISKYGTYIANIRRTGHAALPEAVTAAHTANLPAAWRLLNQGYAALP